MEKKILHYQVEETPLSESKQKKREQRSSRRTDNDKKGSQRAGNYRVEKSHRMRSDRTDRYGTESLKTDRGNKLRRQERRSKTSMAAYHESTVKPDVRREKANKVRKTDPLVITGHALIWGAKVAVVCLLAFACVWFFGQRVSTAGESMSPVLKNGDVVLTNRLSYHIFSPKRGDIVIFHPGGNENTHYVIKRIVGLPGETVQIIDGDIYIDGEKQKKDIYVSEIEEAGLAEEPMQLSQEEYFVMGDNHRGSIDSRSADMGTVRREEIRGKVWFIAGGGRTFGFVKNQED